MRGSKEHNSESLRMGRVSLSVVLLAGLGASVLSCDEVERHQALTFFFDGVPSAGSQSFEEELVNSASQDSEPGGQEPVWYVHEARKDCANCHQKQRAGRFSNQTRLLAPVPNLCYNCHTDFTRSASFVHGPVAVGQCLFCHNPHKSKVKHLLNRPEPKLCLLCHEVSMIELIPAHLAQQTSACTDCHNPHAAATKALLKGPYSPPTGATASQNVGAVNERNQEAPRGPSPTVNQAAIERQNLFEAFWQVSRLIEQGEIAEAKARLASLKDNKALTPEEREKVLNVLRLFDGASAMGKSNGSATQSPRSGDLMSQQERQVADMYYRSIVLYRDGQLARAKEGFIEVLESGLIPDPMAETVRRYVLDIDLKLAQGR